MTCASCVRRVERALAQGRRRRDRERQLRLRDARSSPPTPAVPVETLVAAVEKAGYGASPQTPMTAIASAERDATLARTLLLVHLRRRSRDADRRAGDVDGRRRHHHRGNDAPARLDRARARDADPARARLALLPRRRRRRCGTSTPTWTCSSRSARRAAYAFSAWVVVFDQPYHMFFDVSAAVLVFITHGQVLRGALEGRRIVRHPRAARHVARSRRASSATAPRSRSPLEQLRAGDVFVVRPGEQGRRRRHRPRRPQHRRRVDDHRRVDAGREARRRYRHRRHDQPERRHPRRSDGRRRGDGARAHGEDGRRGAGLEGADPEARRSGCRGLRAGRDRDRARRRSSAGGSSRAGARLERQPVDRRPCAPPSLCS